MAGLARQRARRLLSAGVGIAALALTMRFVALALVICVPAPAAATKPFSVPACQRPSRGEYVVGISGAAGNGTDDFGRDNLIALSSGAENASLFAAPPSTASTRLYPDVFRNPLAARAVLGRLSLRPETDVRLILTGHGSPQGIFLGVTSDGAERRLKEEDFVSAVVKARGAGKKVRADFLACFSGSFMSALMPGKGLASACGVSSTLPEKKAEGCYHDGSNARREDYAATAAALDDCRPGRDWPSVHAAVFERLHSFDIPMLSSDYFLLYGPAAVRLGGVSLAPYPRGTLVRRVLDGGIILYLDLINARVVASRGPKGLLPTPRVSVIDCPAKVAESRAIIDSGHHSWFFLHRSVSQTEKPVPDCVPKVRLEWPRGAAPSSVVTMTELGSDIPWEPRHPFPTHFFEDIGPDDRQIPLEGLKPGARLLLSVILPAFDQSMEGRELANTLKALAAEVEARDPIRGRTMRSLIAAMWIKGGAGKGVYGGTRFHGSWMRKYLTELFSEAEVSEDAVDYSRLTFLAATAVVERELRKEAARDSRARSLVAELDALRACEKTFR